MKSGAVCPFAFAHIAVGNAAAISVFNWSISRSLWLGKQIVCAQSIHFPVVSNAMLFLRLPGYVSRLSNGSASRAVAALQSIGTDSFVKAATTKYGTAQPLLRLSNFTLSAPTAAAEGIRTAFNGGSSAGSIGNIKRGLATIASPDSAAAEIFDRHASSPAISHLQHHTHVQCCTQALA